MGTFDDEGNYTPREVVSDDLGMSFADAIDGTMVTVDDGQLVHGTVVKIDVVTSDESVEAIIEAISGAASTGKIGDGKIWVTDVDNLVRIRTGERGADAV